jgi:hypothetical protein
MFILASAIHDSEDRDLDLAPAMSKHETLQAALEYAKEAIKELYDDEEEIDQPLDEFFDRTKEEWETGGTITIRDTLAFGFSVVEF